MCPAEDGDDACTTCVKQSCCEQLLACEADADCEDADCVCLSDCVVTEADLPQCNADCGVLGINQPFVMLSGCTAVQCMVECGV